MLWGIVFVVLGIVVVEVGVGVVVVKLALTVVVGVVVVGVVVVVEEVEVVVVGVLVVVAVGKVVVVVLGEVVVVVGTAVAVVVGIVVVVVNVVVDGVVVVVVVGTSPETRRNIIWVVYYGCAIRYGVFLRLLFSVNLKEQHCIVRRFVAWNVGYKLMSFCYGSSKGSIMRARENKRMGNLRNRNWVSKKFDQI
jgi:hypothetical protein